LGLDFGGTVADEMAALTEEVWVEVAIEES